MCKLILLSNLFFIEAELNYSAVLIPSVQQSDLVTHTCACSVAQSCPTLWDPMDPVRLLEFCLWNFAGKNTGAGCHFLLQRIFPTEGSNPRLLCLLHWHADSLPLSHLGSPNICIYVCGYIFFFIFLFHYGLSQDAESSSLYYTVGPCCLSFLYIKVCIY